MHREDCRCRGRGLYVITPLEAGYHRVPELDRFGNIASGHVAPVATRTRLSTAFVRGKSVHHFAASDPGGFGRRCAEHAPIHAPIVHAMPPDQPIEEIADAD